MDTRYLKRRHQSWYVQIAVPPALVEAVGKKVIVQSLKTRDLTVARRLRWEVINEVKATFGKLEHLRKSPPPKGSADELLAIGQELRHKARQRLMSDEDAAEEWELLVDDYVERNTNRRTGKPEVPKATAQAIRDLGSAIGDAQARLLSDAIDTHLTELSFTARPSTVKARRRRLEEFKAWLGRDPKLPNVTKADTSRYLTEGLMRLKLAPKSIRDTLSDLSAFWNWAVARNLAEANPWTGLSRSIPQLRRGGVKNTRHPWSKDELEQLLTGINPIDPAWHMAVIALYTGMRANEIAETQLEDVARGHIHIPEGKTESSVRDVPLPPVIRPLVAHLKKSSSDGYLIEGLRRGGADGKRAFYTGKRFGRIKTKLGITRKGIVFHSLRNTFTSAAENAGVPENIAKLIDGHSRGSMTYGRYSRGVELKVLQQEVRKVSFGRIDKLVAERIAELVTCPPIGRDGKRRRP